MNIPSPRVGARLAVAVALGLTTSLTSLSASGSPVDASPSPVVAGVDDPRPPVPAPVHVRWSGRGSSYDDVRVGCCEYSETADVFVTSPRCQQLPAVPADGRCHGEHGPMLRRLRLRIAWSDGRTEVVHVRTPRHVFIEAQPFRARDVRWGGQDHPQQRVSVHEGWPGSGFVPLGTAVRDVRFNPSWPEEQRDGT